MRRAVGRLGLGSVGEVLLGLLELTLLLVDHAEREHRHRVGRVELESSLEGRDRVVERAGLFVGDALFVEGPGLCLVISEGRGSLDDSHSHSEESNRGA